MTEINFYVCKEQGLDNRLAMTYRLLKKAWQREYKIHIHTDSQATSQAVDDYLWTKENESFIPHLCINTEDFESEHSDKTQTKVKEITISHNFEPLKQCDYLVNLSNQRPEFFSRYTKMAEILDNGEEIIAAGRKRYSFYRDRGYTLGYYQL